MQIDLPVLTKLKSFRMGTNGAVACQLGFKKHNSEDIQTYLLDWIVAPIERIQAFIV